MLYHICCCNSCRIICSAEKTSSDSSSDNDSLSPSLSLLVLAHEQLGRFVISVALSHFDIWTAFFQWLNIYCVWLFCVSGPCIIKFFFCYRLSVPVQLIAWKGSSPKWPVTCRVGRKTSLTQRHYQSIICLFFNTAASQGLVSPGGGNWRCHSYFSWKKLMPFFSHRHLQSDDSFSCPTSFVHCSF